MSCLTWHRSKTILLVMPPWPPVEASGDMSESFAQHRHRHDCIGAGMTVVAENKCFNRRRRERHVFHQLRSASESSSRSRGPTCSTDCANPSQNWDIWMYLPSFVAKHDEKARLHPDICDKVILGISCSECSHHCFVTSIILTYIEVLSLNDLMLHDK